MRPEQSQEIALSVRVEGGFIRAFGPRPRLLLAGNKERATHPVRVEHNPTMSFDFAVETTEVQTQTTEDDSEAVPEFEANEVAEIYLSVGDWKSLLGAMLEALDLEPLKIYSDDTLEDVSRLLGEYEEAHPQQKLHMVASLAKSTAGKMQGEANDHGIGLRNGKAPEEHFEESFSYALYYDELPSISWDDLDGGERESLEEMGVDASEVGFDTTYGGPKILVIGDQRLPIAVEEGGEVLEALELLQQIPDEPSHWDDEEGLVASSHPEVFGEADTDKVAEGDDEEVEEVDTDEVDLAENPEAIKSFNVNDIRSGVTDITNLRAIQTMLRVEQENNPRSSAVQRLEERRNAIQNGEEADEADTEEADEASDDEVEEAVEDVDSNDGGLTEAQTELVTTLIKTGEAEDFEAAKQMVQG